MSLVDGTTHDIGELDKVDDQRAFATWRALRSGSSSNDFVACVGMWQSERRSAAVRSKGRRHKAADIVIVAVRHDGKFCLREAEQWVRRSLADQRGQALEWATALPAEDEK